MVLAVRAFEVAAGGVVASVSLERDLGTGDALVEAVEEMAAEATGKLVVQLSDRWEGAARK
jgi:hypothetical protein